jgi:hypothetical protein
MALNQSAPPTRNETVFMPAMASPPAMISVISAGSRSPPRNWLGR